MKFFHIQAKSNEEAEVFLYGTVGTWDRINATDFIAKLQQLQRDYKRVTFRLHSPGGGIIEGMAIYDAMRNSSLHIRTQVDGIAASMGSILALGGDEVVITENARFMVHQGRGGMVGSAKEMRNYADLMDSMNEQLAEIYAKRTGKTKAWILENWMAEGKDTWFTAKEAREEKLVDEIVKGKVQKQAASLQGFDAMVAFYDSALDEQTAEPFNEETKNRMKQLAKHLDLPEDATEQQFIDAVEGIRKAGATNSVATLILLGKKSGLITEENEATYTALAEKDFSSVKALVEGYKAPEGKQGEQDTEGGAQAKSTAPAHESIVDAIKSLTGQVKGGNANDRSAWTLEDWQNKDEAGLLKMKQTETAKYDALVKAYYGG